MIENQANSLKPEHPELFYTLEEVMWCEIIAIMAYSDALSYNYYYI
jgi:hypothetical protein